MKIDANDMQRRPSDPENNRPPLEGEDAEQFLDTLMRDPDTEIGPPDKRGNCPIFYKEHIIGFLNPGLGIGAIDPDAYAQLCGEDDTLDIDTDPDVSDTILSAEEITEDEEAADEEPKSDLEQALEEALTEDICVDIVNLAYSESNEFASDVFIDAEDFFDVNLGNADPQDIALKFFEGKDLDDDGPANPNRDYLRFDADENIESTDDPGAIYLDTLLDDIIKYVIDHKDEFEFDEDIQNILNDYLDDDEEER